MDVLAKSPSWSKCLCFAIMSLFFMGNEGCEQQPEPSVRQLKKTAKLGALEVPNKLYLPDGTLFDFTYLANAQMYDLLTRKDQKYFTPAVFDVIPQNRMQELTMMSQESYDTLLDWGNPTDVNPFAAEPNPLFCVQFQPMVEISGSIKDFEFFSKVGFHFGFGPDFAKQGLPPKINGDIEITKATLHSALRAKIPSTERYIATARADAESVETKSDFAINFFNLVRIGMDYYKKTPLADVIEYAFTGAFKKLYTDIESLGDKDVSRPTWYVPLRETDGDVKFQAYGGSDHGLKIGDELAVYNAIHLWEGDGEPCKVPYQGFMVPPDDEPVAILKVIALTETISLLKPIVAPTSGRPIHPGAVVTISKLVPLKPAPAQAKR